MERPQEPLGSALNFLSGADRAALASAFARINPDPVSAFLGDLAEVRVALTGTRFA